MNETFFLFYTKMIKKKNARSSESNRLFLFNKESC